MLNITDTSDIKWVIFNDILFYVHAICMVLIRIGSYGESGCFLSSLCF